MPGARRNPHVLQDNSQKPRRDLFAGSDNSVIFAGVMHWRCFLAPGNQLVRGSSHGRDDDRHMVAGLHLTQDMARHIADTPDVRNLELIAGRANFEVAKDITRPLKVRVGPRIVTALGTSLYGFGVPTPWPR